MSVFYKRIDLRGNKKVAEHVVKDFSVDYETKKRMMYNTFTTGDETGFMYYTYKERKNGNRVEFKGVDPCGDGFIEIMTNYL